MAKKKRPQPKRPSVGQQQEKKEKPPVPQTNEPWLSKRTGLGIMIVFTLAFAAFIAYQLEPSLGLLEAILWGLGFGAATWGVFGLALAFNRFVRRR
ncbi:MAG: hypothetical protein GX579_08380 [Chloroflexi bacterium]|jgi:hypothetical protein|nr:hypothetical protein [Chloroflexota bacterium]